MSILYIFVEGPSDERFFRHFFGNSGVKYLSYAKMRNKDINNYIKTIKLGSTYDYLFFADADGCSLEEKRKRIVEKYHDCEEKKIIVVQYEIESWYLAGLTQKDAQCLKVQYIAKTDSVRKEQFISLIPKRFSSATDFMLEILKCYDCSDACLRNNSFSIFFNKYKNRNR